MNGFDFTRYMRRLAEDMTARLPELSHIDMHRVAVAFCQTRKPVMHGMWASLTPLRFAGGSLTTRRRGRHYTIERLFAPDGREMLYILSFYLPRFLDLPLHEKLATVVHELWHIGPRFDGDLRRHEGRCFAHGASQKEYDAHVRVLTEAWLARNPPSDLCDELRGSFTDLRRRHASIIGTRIPAPKLIPMREAG